MYTVALNEDGLSDAVQSFKFLKENSWGKNTLYNNLNFFDFFKY